MNSKLLNSVISFEKNRLSIAYRGDKKTVIFKSDVMQIERFSSVLVVRTHPKISPFLNENVFGVSYDGKILWQIEKLNYVYSESPFTGMAREGDNIKLCNWDGTDLIVNPATGKIISKGWGK